MYLKKNRLADIMALIQVLALDQHAHRSLSGLEEELQGKPKSGESWADIANDHPEFFRYTPTGNHGVSLISRHVLPKDNHGVCEQLPMDFTHKLLETAILLHDKQVKRSERWSIWIPILAVLVSGAISLIVTFNKQEQKSQPNTYFKATEQIPQNDTTTKIIIPPNK